MKIKFKNSTNFDNIYSQITILKYLRYFNNLNKNKKDGKQ